MELRGYTPHTQNHYLGHVKLLEKFTNKPALQITPNELKQYIHDRIKFGIGYSSITVSCMKMTGNKPLPLTIKIQKDAKSCRFCGSTDVITILVPNSFATASSA